MKGQLHASAALLPGKDPRYPLDRRLDWSYSQAGHFLRKEKSLAPAQNWTWFTWPSSRSSVTVSTERNILTPKLTVYYTKQWAQFSYLLQIRPTKVPKIRLQPLSFISPDVVAMCLTLFHPSPPADTAFSYLLGRGVPFVFSYHFSLPSDKGIDNILKWTTPSNNTLSSSCFQRCAPFESNVTWLRKGLWGTTDKSLFTKGLIDLNTTNLCCCCYFVLR